MVMLMTIDYRKMPRIALNRVCAEYQRTLIVGFVLRESTSGSRPALAISTLLAEPEPTTPGINIAN